MTPRVANRLQYESIKRQLTEKERRALARYQIRLGRSIYRGKRK